MSGKPYLFGPAVHPRDRHQSLERNSPERKIGRELNRIRTTVGEAIHEERRRRGLTIRDLASLAQVGLATVHAAEAGEAAGLETYVRLAEALRLRAELDLVDPRRREPATKRAQDPVHTAMGEAQAAHLLSLGFRVGMDEPYQHFQFSGRGDVVAWSPDRAALLHVENRTRFPDIQEAFGAFNGKRLYLAADVAARVGVAQWRSETHVVAALWSSEALRVIRAHAASFTAVCPDPSDAFKAWWAGKPPFTGRWSILVIFDPVEGRRSERRGWACLADLDGLRPRYRDYSDAVAALSARNSVR